MRIFASLMTVFIATLAAQAADKSPRILILGDSLTSGYSLGKELAYPNLLQQKIDAAGWDFKVVNAGVSGDTSSGGLRRIDWLLKAPVDIFILELGANDGLRGINLTLTKRNLLRIFKAVRQAYPDAELVLAGMKVPPNLGSHYFESFENMFPEVAAEAGAKLIPFLMEGVAGYPEYIMNDGLHPTKEGHAIMADNVWKVLKPLLESRMNTP